MTGPRQASDRQRDGQDREALIESVHWISFFRSRITSRDQQDDNVDEFR